MSFNTRSALVVMLLAAFVASAAADPIAKPRRDLWNNPACHAHALDPYDDPYSSKMLGFNYAAAKAYETGGLRAMRAQLAAAYNVAREHCVPLRLGDADLAFDERKYPEAFADYRNGFFFPGGGGSIGPPDFDSGGLPPLHEGLNAAANGDYKTAEADIRESIDKDHDFQAAHFVLGDLFFATGHAHDARREWLAALGSTGLVAMNKDELGPDPPWLSALRLYELHRSE
jgi:hypothetical protein